MKGERPVKIRLMRDQLRINCEESSPDDVLRLSVALCANCVARLVPFACRAPLARGRRPVFLPPCGHSAGHAIRAQRRRPSQCSPFHSQFSASPLPLFLSRSPHLAVNVFLGFASALSLSVMLPDDVDGRVSLSLFAVIHPCTANSACMNYEMKGGTKAIFRSPDSGRRWSLARSTAGDQWSVGLTAGAGQ